MARYPGTAVKALDLLESTEEYNVRVTGPKRKFLFPRCQVPCQGTIRRADATQGHSAGAIKSAFLLSLLAIIFGSVSAWAGPPFQTDDPEPIDFRNYEFYTFATADGTPVEMDTAGPAADFNWGTLPNVWGTLPNVHLHIIVPLATILPSNSPSFAPAGTGPSAFGLGDIETGIKFRFIQESKLRPMVGTFTMFELPTGSAVKGLGVGKT